MKLYSVRRGMCCAVGISLLAASLVGCSTVQKPDEASTKAAAQEQVNEKLAAADKAQQQGQHDKALELLDSAIKVDPAAKAPWLRKAQIHFDARQYGLAITEAQEVLQRDVNDLTAKSILAVSGLRVSADALEQLRKANEVTGSTRSEAESVARIIREALGEPILPAPAAAEANARGRAPRTAARAPAAPLVRTAPVPPSPSAAPAAPATVAPAKPAATGGSPRSNPFGALQ